MKKFFLSLDLVLLAFLIVSGNGKSISKNSSFTAPLEIYQDISSQDKKVIFEGYSNISSQSSSSDLVYQVSSSSNPEILFQLNDSFSVEFPNLTFLSTAEEVDQKLHEYRNQVASYFSSINQAFLDSLSLEYESYFLSKYTPFVGLVFSSDDFDINSLNNIYSIASSTQVKKVYIRNGDISSTPALSSALPVVDLPATLNNGYEYDGTGVNIGIIEQGVPDKNNDNMISSLLTIKDYDWIFYKETVDIHTTRVASIVGGNTGIARGAHIFSIELKRPTRDNYIICSEWLIDNDVNIINNSWGFILQSGLYESSSAYFDYLIYSTKVVIVSAAGNLSSATPENYVLNPWLAYNVITVGATDDAGGVTSYSLWEEEYGVSKPTIVAPGDSISLPDLADQDANGNYINSGTSFSSPIVTGIIALLMEKYPILKAHPEIVIAMITAGADPVSGLNDFDSSGFEEVSGAGIANFAFSDSIASTLNGTQFSYSANYANQYLSSSATKLVYLHAGDNIRISLAWLVNSNQVVNSNIVTNLSIHISSTSGVLYASSSGVGNNVEMIEYTAPYSSYYYIKVFQVGNKIGTDTIFAAFRYRIFLS